MLEQIKKQLSEQQAINRDTDAENARLKESQATAQEQLRDKDAEIARLQQVAEEERQMRIAAQQFQQLRIEEPVAPTRVPAPARMATAAERNKALAAERKALAAARRVPALEQVRQTYCTCMYL